MAFDDDTALSPRADGGYDGAVVDGWSTPRGPLGGYVMAIVLRGMMLAVGDDARQPRSLTMHFLRVPEVGPVVVRPTIEREGRSLTSVSARLEQDGRLLGLAVGAFSTAWPVAEVGSVAMPDVAPPNGRAAPQGDLVRTDLPAFTGRLSMEQRIGAAPFSGAERGEIGGWLALQEERPVDALTVTLLADAWYPAPWPRMTDFAAAPTIDLTVHYRAPLPLPDGPLLGHFTNAVVRDGFFDEDGLLWTADGTLVAQSRQLGLLIPPRG